MDATQAPALSQSLADAIKAAPDTTLVIFDTDAELCERPSSTIAAAAADKIAIVASSNWADFLRVLTDPHNSIIDFLEGIASSGRNARKLEHFVFTNLPKTRNNEYNIHNAPVLNFQPNKTSVENVEQIVSYIYERHTNGPFAPYITEPRETRISEFTQRLVSGMLTFPEAVIQRATLQAVPIATMTVSASTADALDISKQTLVHVANRVLVW